MATEAVQNIYLWQGTDKNGNKTKGEIQGSSQALVKTQLRKQGVNPTKVKKKLNYQKQKLQNKPKKQKNSNRFMVWIQTSIN